MTERITVGSLQVAKTLYDFINEEALPGTDIDQGAFWGSVNEILGDLAPRNRELLALRDTLQAQIDAWHQARKGQEFDPAAYKSFLSEIGYLVEEGDAFSVDTDNVDPEISTVAGPQLVVPVMNARYALNAANARWGSLYDALYGTDAISEDGGATLGGGYNAVRGAKVIAYARGFLDDAAPLAGGSHADATGYAIRDAKLAVTLAGGETVGLKDDGHLAGYLGDAAAPSTIAFVNNGIHFEIRIDASHPIGKDDPANVSDVVMESAITTIMDCEDSIAAVDADDKVVVYRNWLGLMRGDLTESFEKGGETVHRKLNADHVYTKPDGTNELMVPGRSLMLIRNVGHLMSNAAILDQVTAMKCRRASGCHADRRSCAKHDSAGAMVSRANSRAGLGLYREAQDAWPGRSRLCIRNLRAGRRCSRPSAQYDQDGHHGRGTPDDGQPEGMHPGGKASVLSSLIPGSWTGPAMRCTRRWKPAR